MEESYLQKKILNPKVC